MTWYCQHMKLGFTGTQFGMTAEQLEKFKQLIAELQPKEFHHGDCVGADAEAHQLIVNTGCKIIIHPPKNETKRAFCGSDTIRKPKDYLVRNHDIVDETEVTIATPREHTEQMRSGTWATVRYCSKSGKKVYIILPDGQVK